MTSIFDIERRVNLNTAYERILSMADEECFYISPSYLAMPSTLWEVINGNIRKWKYREGANNYQQYFNDIGIKVIRGNIDDTSKMLVIEFLLNMVWVLLTNVVSKNETYREPYKQIMDSIKYMMEKLNYSIYANSDKLQFSKRDADVDSVIESISEEECRLLLLEYNDFRIAKDVTKKNNILFKIGKFIEPNRKIYNQYNTSLTNVVFRLLNEVYIRHNNSKQLDIPDGELLGIYDKLFKMMLHLIRTVDICTYKKEINEYLDTISKAKS